MLEYSHNYAVVFLPFLGEDQDVIQVDGHLSFSDQVSEDVVHHPLESGGRVREPEEHDCGFKQPPICVKSRLFFVSLLYVDIVIPPLDVKLGEVLGSMELVDEFGDQGEGVLVLDCYFIELAVVLYQT